MPLFAPVTKVTDEDEDAADMEQRRRSSDLSLISCRLTKNRDPESLVPCAPIFFRFRTVVKDINKWYAIDAQRDENKTRIIAMRK